MTDIIASLYVFMLAAFVGFEVIRRVSPLLHTPLMSLTNALDAIAVVGAIILAGEHKSTLATVLGTIAIVAVAQVGSLFSADAWNNVTFTAGEIRNPKRNLPISLALGVYLLYALLKPERF